MSIKRKVQRQEERNHGLLNKLKLAEGSYNNGFGIGYKEGYKDGVLAHAAGIEDKLLSLPEVNGIGPKTYEKILLHLRYQQSEGK